MMTTTEDETDFRALTDGAGFVELVDWNFISLTGRDRHRLLHNFCTANINQLSEGHTTEAFILNEKGKTLWFGFVLAMPNQLLLCGASPIGENIRAHLDRFVIREDVEIVDQSTSLCGCFIAGKEAAARLSDRLCELNRQSITLQAQNRVIQTQFDRSYVTVANIEIAGWGLLMTFPSLQVEAIEKLLADSKIEQCRPAALNTLRVTSVTPWYGQDIDDSNLPQEVNRDEKAISFTKGCYLGQETVARIDALGHVNQILVGFKFLTDVEPARDMQFEHEGKKIGRVTSIAKSAEGFIGMGYLRREFTKAGQIFPYTNGQVVVR